MGVDLFDLARCREASANGVVLTAWGPRLPLEHEATSVEAQAYHMVKALDEVRAAVMTGSLRTLAVQQSQSSPRLVEHLRRHQELVAEQKGVLASHRPASTEFACFSSNALTDPLVVDWERFMTEDYEAPAPVRNVMILLPCSARKPYRLSKSHAQFLRAIASTGCHEVMMTSPLGLVPRDLEDVWPAANYDVPVTGDWSSDELGRVRRMLTALVQRVGYSEIINHTDMDLSFLSVDVVNTRQGQGSTNFDALARLGAAVKDARERFDLKNQKNNLRLKEHFKSIARKATGTDAWCEAWLCEGSFLAGDLNSTELKWPSGPSIETGFRSRGQPSISCTNTKPSRRWCCVRMWFGRVTCSLSWSRKRTRPSEWAMTFGSSKAGNALSGSCCCCRLGMGGYTRDPCEISSAKEEIMSLQYAVVWRSD